MRRPRPRRIGFRHALHGLACAWRDGTNLRIQLAVGAAALALATWLDAPLVPVILASGLVLSMETMNTAIEGVVDIVRPDHDPLAGRVKDIAASAVLLAAVASLGVGVAVLGPPLIARLGG